MSLKFDPFANEKIATFELPQTSKQNAKQVTKNITEEIGVYHHTQSESSEQEEEEIEEPEPEIQPEPEPEPEPIKPVIEEKPVEKPKTPEPVAPPEPVVINGEVVLPKNPLGLENNAIKDRQITASDNHNEGQIICHAYYARLRTDKSWIAKGPPNAQSFITIDLLDKHQITNIATQGQAPRMVGIMNTVNRWTTKYYVQYSDDNTKWKLHKSRFERQYMTTFEGNQDHSDIKLNTFDPPLEARYVKIVPTKAFKQGSAALRIELFVKETHTAELMDGIK